MDIYILAYISNLDRSAAAVPLRIRLAYAYA